MNKRNRVRRRKTNSTRGNLLNSISGRVKRRYKTWTFERLEERHLFSATPIVGATGGTGSFNGYLTSEQVAMGELWWAFKQVADLSQYSTEQLQNTTQWAMWTVDPDSGNAAGSGFSPYLGGSEISVLNAEGMTYQDVISVLSLRDDLVSFYPLVDGGLAPSTFSPIDEPLFESQWHLRNTGQKVGNPDFQDLFGVPGEDLNVLGAWNQGYSGEGVVVGVVDTGIEWDHPDLIGNYRPDLSFDFYEEDTNPLPEFSVGGAHGTAVSGIIGADGDNNYGVVGIAYNVGLAGLRVGSGEPGLEALATDADIARVLTFRNDEIDIYNHSWGEAVDGRQIVPIGPQTIFALRQSALFGRPGPDGKDKGNIHVFGSGNDAGHDFPPAFPGSGNWDSASYEGIKSSRYGITVTGVDHDGAYENADGTFTNYPEAGPNVLIAAPTGSHDLNIGLDTGTGSGVWTTDLTGDDGINSEGVLDFDFEENTDFTSRFNGTSAAAPMVSGVVALMLEANPNLSYRDVQEILLRSARQNDPLSESWQTNFMEVFQDPDQGVFPDPMDTDPSDGIDLITLPLEDAFFRIDGTGSSPSFYPGALNKFIDNYSLNNLPNFANGAGYTVSEARGIYSEMYGWAHGVVDADLAVSLARQWHQKGQQRPDELTYTTFVRQLGNTAGRINGRASVGPQNSAARWVIPGSLADGPVYTFPAFYQEFWNMMPFSSSPTPVNDRGGPGVPLSFLDGFEPPLMEIEWVELKVEIFGDTDDISNLRIAIRSPDGTISDLSMFLQPEAIANVNNTDMGLVGDFATSPAEGGSPFIYTFSSNRHWGERSDAFFEVDEASGALRLDPDTGLPVGNPFGTGRSWDLVIENYSDSQLTLDTFEFIFHGKALAAGSERIQGHVGVDSGVDGIGRDDGAFNFTGTIDQDIFDNQGNFGPDGNVDDLNQDGYADWRFVDPFKEDWGTNVTVRVRDDNGGVNDGQIVAEFITGADGNFYFDLAPGNYTVEVFDPLGRGAKQGAGLSPEYQSFWQITVDPTDNFTRNAGRAVPVDADGNGLQDQGPGGIPLVRYEAFDDVNFLLEAGPAPPSEVDVSGFVFADVDGNGVFDSSDSEAPGFRIYADLNDNGAFEQGEPNSFTDTDGLYTFTIPNIDAAQIIVIRGEAPMVGWLPTVPVGGVHTIFRGPGEEETNLDFGFFPPPDVIGGDPGDPGIILGQVFQDRNGNGVKNPGDTGVAGVRVFIDLDLDGVFDFTDGNGNGQFDEGEASERFDVTNDNGGYTFEDVAPGTVQIDVVVPTDWILSSPTNGFREVTLPDGGVLTSVLFGITNLATRDFGDLPDSYQTRLADNGPRHEIIPGFVLGGVIDGETNGQPTADATGDDAVANDEDGVVLLGAVAGPTGELVAGATNRIQVTVQGVGGYLNAWMDFNGDGHFADSERVFMDTDLNPGTHILEFVTPSDMDSDAIAARFRWGSAGLNFFGPAVIGEVEDYRFANADTPPVFDAVPGDYDSSGLVDQLDYDLWKSTYGSTTNLAADGNNSGVIDLGDYSIWRDHVGQSTPGSGSGGASTASQSTPRPTPKVLSGEAALAARRAQLGIAEPSAALVALMQQMGATAVVQDYGILGTRTVFSLNSPTAGQGSGSSQPATGSASTPEASGAGSAGLANLPGLQFFTTVSPLDSSSDVRSISDVADTPSDVNLLVVDQVLARLVDEDEDADEDEALAWASCDEDDELELALAAAFEEKTDWRNLL